MPVTRAELRENRFLRGGPTAHAAQFTICTAEFSLKIKQLLQFINSNQVKESSCSISFAGAHTGILLTNYTGQKWQNPLLRVMLADTRFMFFVKSFRYRNEHEYH